jgi:hypothetical protein
MIKRLALFCILFLPLPAFAQGTIKHLIFIVKENRSFDHLFNCFPGTGSCLETYPQKGKQVAVVPGVATNKDCNACGGHDCPHTHGDFVMSYDSGLMDDFQIDSCINSHDWAVSYGNACSASLPSLSGCQIPNYWQWATTYGLGQIFASAMAPTFPSHMIIFSGTTSETMDNPNSMDPGNFPNGGKPGGGTANWNLDAFHQGTCGVGSTANGNGNCVLNTAVDSGTLHVKDGVITWLSGQKFSTNWTNVPIMIQVAAGAWKYTIASCSSTTTCTLTTKLSGTTSNNFTIPDLACSSSANALVAGSCWFERDTGICCRQGQECNLTQSAPSCTLNTDCPSTQTCVKGNRYFGAYSGIDLAGSAGYTGNIGQVNVHGTSVEWVSGDYFRQWPAGTQITIGGANYSIQSITSYSALQLSASAPTQNNASYTVAATNTGGSLWPGSCTNHPAVSCYCLGNNIDSGCATDPDPACTALGDTCGINANVPRLQQGSRGGVDVEVTTIADLLNSAGVSWAYYSDLNELRIAMSYYAHLWYNPVYRARYFQATPNFANDAAACTSDSNCNLSSVVWLQGGATTDEHPPNPIGIGETWTATQVDAVMKNPYLWNNTAIFIMWDDYGGFYDHVAPTVDAQNWRNGFRLPVICVGKYCKLGFNSSKFVFESGLMCVENLFLQGTRLPGNLFDAPSTGTLDLCTGSSTGGTGHTNNPGMIDLTLDNPALSVP